MELWLAITKSYFKNNNFEVFGEKPLNKEVGTQFRANNNSSSQLYIFNFYKSGRIVINTKDSREKFLQTHIPSLEELYGVSFTIKVQINNQKKQIDNQINNQKKPTQTITKTKRRLT